MSLLLHSITDPRDRLEKARQLELYKYAKANGVTEIDRKDMPAPLMRRILRGKGLTNIPIPNRVLGQPEPMPRRELLSPNGQPQKQGVPEKVVEADAEADLARQWAAEQQREKEDVTETKPGGKREAWRTMLLKDMGINDLRWACKAHEIKLTRKSNIPEMRKLLAEKGLK